MASSRDASDFDSILSCLIEPSLARLAAQLASVTGLAACEVQKVHSAVGDSLIGLLHSKLSRLLLVELHAARLTGRLDAADPGERWDQFIHIASQPEFWDAQAHNYPTLACRVRRMVENRCASALAFARHFAADRLRLDVLHGGPLGALERLSLGAGDSHESGRTVALLYFAQGSVVYKPRSLRIDRELAGLLQRIVEVHPGATSMRVPRVLDCGNYGWAEFVAHRFTKSDTELRSFYLGVGHWLALMRLLSGSDLHAENLIAHGPHPVVVDCETLFTPQVPNPLSQLGAATDQAARWVSGTVLSVGLLPGRGQGLGWRGIDTSALGALPGQQPMTLQPVILKAGTDEAHIGQELVASVPAQNHPSAVPALSRYWGEVLRGFEELTHTLQRLDNEGVLEQWLAPFADCRVRVVTRATEVYAELARMLWHPASLSDEANARARAEDLLTRMGAHIGVAPSDPAVVRAEVQDLLDGDVPIFSTRVREGRLQGPGGTEWLPAQDLAAAALREWRTTDLRLEQHVIRAALVSAYINDGWMPADDNLGVSDLSLENLDKRRRRCAADILRQLLATAIRADDGTVAWIAPVLGPNGWSVQPLEQDLYGGLSGLAVLVAAYLNEEAAGRVDVVPGLTELLQALLNTLELAEIKLLTETARQGQRKLRPQSPGGFIGLASQIWTWLVLERLGHVDVRSVDRACALAELLPEAVRADSVHDLLTGKAGAIPVLLQLAQRCGQQRYLQMARDIGDALCASSRCKEGSPDQVFWPAPQWPAGMGGFVHGSTGIAWALTQLARATGEARFAAVAAAAEAFEDALWDDHEQNWLDLRALTGAKSAAAWCHGAMGIGLASMDLDPHLANPRRREVVRRAAAATWRKGMGWNHSLCHGDASCHAFLLRAVAAGVAPDGLSRERLLAEFLGSLEAHGPICGIARDVFVPGLMPGLGGVAYQLLAFHPDSQLPDVLTLGSSRPHGSTPAREAEPGTNDA